MGPFRLNFFVQPRLSNLVEDYRSLGPGEIGLAHIELRNDGAANAFVSKLWLHFDWQGDLSYPFEVGKYIEAGRKRTVGPIHFEVPNTVVGSRKFKVGVEAPNQLYSGGWVNQGLLWTEDFDFVVEPYPTYTVFVSCSNRAEERDIVDFVKARIRLWAFNPVTVGQEVEASGELAETIRKYAQVPMPILIAIATPRILDAITNAWETLPWVQSEAAITYGREKPILILRDRKIKLSGLIGQLPWQVDYDPDDQEELSAKLHLVMPSFRAWISSKKSSEFLGTLLKIGVAAVGIAVAYEAGREAGALQSST